MVLIGCISGEEIARLEYAQQLFTACQQRGGRYFNFFQFFMNLVLDCYFTTRPSLGGCQDWAKRAERALTDAKKDNDFIYHERIPEVKALTSIGRAAVVKPTAVPDTFIPGEKELFAALMPVHIHQAVAAYEVRKQELVGKEVGRLKEGTNMMNEILTSMNLPAGLEDTTGGGVPASLVEKCQAVVAAGGVSVNKTK